MELFESEHVLLATSTIADGNMGFRFGEPETVVENRRAFLAAHDIAWNDHICMQCENGGVVAVVDEASGGRGAAAPAEELVADALTTATPGLTLMLLTADCIPAAFYDPEHHVIALAHLNRKTIAHDLAKKTVEHLQEQFGTDPAQLLVHFVPHIKQTSYHYPIPLAEPTPPQLAPFIEERDGEAYIDQTAAHLSQLTEIGVRPECISASDIDVATDDRYFSHYRSKHDASRPAGRMATIFMLR